MNHQKSKEETHKSQSGQDHHSKSKKQTAKEEKRIEELEKKLIETESKLGEANDKYLRLSAEFDNYRKRTLKEKIDLLKTAGEETITKILPVVDDLERALNSIDNVKEPEPVKEGIVLIYNKFKDILAQQGLKEIEALNLDFNTDHHEAITKVPAPEEKMKGKVLEVVQKGYMLGDKVIRFARVIVGE